MKQLIRFAIVGTIGFCVDALILMLLVNIFSFEIYLARVFSFLSAVFTTWIINRKFTFEKSNFSKKVESSYYLTVQTFGASLNYLIFILLVQNIELFKTYLVLPLGIAALIAMIFNFYFLKKKVFI